MSRLRDIRAITVGGESVSLAEMFEILRSDGKLQFLKEAVRSVLIRQAAEKAGISVTDEELQAAVDEFRRENRLQSTKDTMDWLKQRSMSVDDLENRLLRAVLARKLRDAVTGGKEEQYFAEHRAEFDAAVISQIVVDDEGLASELKSQIDDEESEFSVLAKRYSIDATTTPAGGYLGTVSRHALSAPIQAAVFGASPGEVVGPIHADKLYYLIRVEALEDTVLDDTKRVAIADRLFEDYLFKAERQAAVKFDILTQI